MIDFGLKYALINTVFNYPSGLFSISSKSDKFKVVSMLEEAYGTQREDEDGEPIDNFLLVEAKQTQKGYVVNVKLSFNASIDGTDGEEVVVFRDLVSNVQQFQILHASIHTILNERKITLDKENRGVFKAVQLIPQVLFMIDSTLPEYSIQDDDDTLEVSSKYKTLKIHPHPNQNTLVISYYANRRDNYTIPLTTENLVNVLLPKR